MCTIYQSAQQPASQHSSNLVGTQADKADTKQLAQHVQEIFHFIQSHIYLLSEEDDEGLPDIEID